MGHMKSAVLLIVHILVLIVKALRTGGVKALIAENILLKHQLGILARTRQKSPNLKTSDRFLLGALSLLVSPRRIFTVAIIIKPADKPTFVDSLDARRQAVGERSPASATRRVVRHHSQEQSLQV